MSRNSKTIGLTARRWTINNFRTFSSILTRVFNHAAQLALIALFFCTSCNERSEAQTMADGKKKTTAPTDSLSKPKVNIKVNRHFDDKGNMVGFDSTYSTFYSNMNGDTMKMDSLMKSFDRYFYRDHSSLMDRHFNDLFFTDSLRYPDFFHRDFFMKRYELNDAYMRDMMRGMDSLKNRFFYEQSRKDKEAQNL
jgi:hypothetical protein